MNTKKNWYALYTRSRSEKAVHKYLSSRSIESYLPLTSILKQWSDRKKWIEQVLIPGYVFVYINEINLLALAHQPNVVSILKSEGKAAIIREYEIENLKILTNDVQSIALLSSSELIEGELIEVIKGPFFGLTGVFVGSRGRHKLLVDFPSLNQLFGVEIPVSFIKTKLAVQ